MQSFRKIMIHCVSENIESVWKLSSGQLQSGLEFESNVTGTLQSGNRLCFCFVVKFKYSVMRRVRKARLFKTKNMNLLLMTMNALST